MASAPGAASHEDEPLLGRPGDATQAADTTILYNLYLGTGAIAQAGILILTALVWSAVFSHDRELVSAHPLVNSAGILLLTQAILILQPTTTQAQKISGTFWHAGFNNAGTALLVAGLIVIEVNKYPDGKHFYSVHGVMGLVTYICILVQAGFGIALFFLPDLVGGVANAKKMYRYHRISGYLFIVLALATICAATQVTYNKDVLGIKLWAALVASVLTLVGVLPRIKKAKVALW